MRRQHALCLLGLAVASTATAGSVREYATFNEGLVVGANLTVALGEVSQGGRFGAGLDGWYQVQWYRESSAQIDGDFEVWIDPRLMRNYGPALHVWRVGGAWNTSFGARYGYARPLAVGLGRGWYPGPGLTGELAMAVSTAGHVGLDGQVVLDGPWTQVRLGTTTTFREFLGPRMHVGALSPWERPVDWDGSIVKL